MIVNASNTGLLSRMGPSLIHPGAFIDQSSFRNFSTNTLLDAFHPNPRIGMPFVPVLEEGAFSVSVLDANIAEGFRRTVKGIAQDAARVVRLQRRFGQEAEYSLPMTNGHWVVNEFEESGSSLLMELRSVSRKLRRIELENEGVSKLSLGWVGEEAIAIQHASVNAQGEVSTDGYHFEFFNGGMRAIAVFLEMEDEPGASVAQRLADRIYNSTQYGHDDIVAEAPTLEGDPKALKEFNYQMMDAHQPERPLVNVGWQHDDMQGHLVVTLRRPTVTSLPALMPLTASLEELLWEGALALIY